eukprot:scaffold12174_cov121-Isochrysis_galbana.AAC.3
MNQRVPVVRCACAWGAVSRGGREVGPGDWLVRATEPGSRMVATPSRVSLRKGIGQRGGAHHVPRDRADALVRWRRALHIRLLPPPGRTCCTAGAAAAGTGELVEVEAQAGWPVRRRRRRRREEDAAVRVAIAGGIGSCQVDGGHTIRRAVNQDLAASID